MPKPSQLVAINLKFGGHARPLKDLALADIALNAIFILGAPSTVEEVAEKAAKLVGLPAIDPVRVKEVLGQLRNEGKARGVGTKWELSPTTADAMQAEKDQALALLKGVLERHFPKNIEEDKLIDWFYVAASAFFGFNAAESLKAISKSAKPQFSRPHSIQQLIVPSIKSAGLKEHEAALVAAFTGFIESGDHSDLAYITHLMFALFSAQMIAADTGADPVGIDEIRDALFILDTNVLFAIKQDASRFARSLKALGQAMQEIGATLVYIDSTRQEYRRVYTGRTNEIAARFREFDPEVVLDADDDFIKSGLTKGYKTPEELSRYFEENLYDLPVEVPSGPAVSLKDDGEIEKAVKDGAKDEKLKSALQRHRRRMLWYPKTETALCHDAGLLHVVEFERKTQPKTWVLSIDRSLRACAAERAGAHGEPPVFMLDGLIQMLAIYAGGPSRSAEDFAPLLTNILVNRCTPSEKTYDLEDLGWLHSVIERAADFPPDKVKKLLAIVVRHRLGGSNDERKLELIVNRAYHSEKRAYEEELAEERARALAAEAKAQSAGEELAAAQAGLAVHAERDCKYMAKIRFAKRLLWRVPLSLVITVAIYAIAKAAFPQNEVEIFPWVASLISFAAPFKWLYWKPITDFQSDLHTCHHF